MAIIGSRELTLNGGLWRVTIAPPQGVASSCPPPKKTKKKTLTSRDDATFAYSATNKSSDTKKKKTNDYKPGPRRALWP